MDMPDHHEYCTGDFGPDDIVISGISGRFPHCSTLEELQDAMCKQRYLLFETGERYPKGAHDIPFGSAGTISDIDKFDAEFFRYSLKAADWVDAQQRLILEVSYQAIADAGYDPFDLRGANIGVYTAISNEDGKELMGVDIETHSTMGPGYLRCMAANRCSYFFDFRGPSYTMDTACSSSFVGLWAACCDIREGRIDAALVNASQLCLSPINTKLYFVSKIVSETLESNPFDERANGFIRSEAVTALFIQKASAARRAYSTIMHIKHCSSGYVPEGITVPSYRGEVQLFSEVMKETGLDPEEIQYIEAHGTGTQVGDPIETSALETVYCQGRKKPLYIGSVKSNVGHAEATAGITGAIKVILGMETGLMSPNHGFKTPNPNCEALVKGIIKVVTEPLPLTARYVPVNSFGFGGSFVQAILKKNGKEYPAKSEPEDLPRLVLYPATTEAAVLHVFDYIKSHPELRSEFFALLNKLSFTPVASKPYRGYALFQNQHPVVHVKNSVREKEREVWFVMTGMGCQWAGMGLEMMRIKVFADSMRKSAEVLKPYGIHLFELLQKDKNYLNINRSITPAFVAIAAIQIALVDVLRALDIQPDGIVGHSTGELICAYADGCCTAEQTILSAYMRGQSVERAGLAEGLMAAVGLTWEEAVRRCPEGVFPACHNAEDSVTISGLREPLEKFVAELQQENIFARVVNAYGYAFHCEHVWPASRALKDSMLKILPNPKSRSKRWISTSYPESQWDTEDCKTASAEYFVHNLMSVVRFSDVLKKIPPDAVTIEIGPHFLLQSILKRSIGQGAAYIGLMKRNDENNIGFFLESLGKLYVEGVNPKIENLYRPVQFPVPRGTPMISDLIQWDHSRSYRTVKWAPEIGAYKRKFELDGPDRYLLDHFIDGRPLFPATGYILLAWEAISKRMLKKIEEVSVVIEDFKIHRATILSSGSMYFYVTLFEDSGRFEITENNTLVASGRVYDDEDIAFCEAQPTINEDTSFCVSGEEIYNELRIQGYEYGPCFRRLVETSFTGKEGFVEWKDWISFMDAMLLFYMLSNTKSVFMLPTGALSFKICPQSIKKGLKETQEMGLPGLPVSFHTDTKVCRTVGIEIRNLEVDPAPQHVKPDNCILEEYKFIPYIQNYSSLNQNKELKKYMTACNKLIDELKDSLRIDLRDIKFPLNQNNIDLDSYIQEVCTERKILATLKELLSAQKERKGEKFKEIAHSYIRNLGRDITNSLLLNDYCLRFMFDIISENRHGRLNVIEVNNNFTEVLPDVVEAVERGSMSKFKSKILASKDAENIDQNKLSENDIKLCSYDSLSAVAQEKDQSLVISSIGAETAEAAHQHVKLISSMVEEKGFVLLFHKNRILPPENLFASLSGEKISIVPEPVIESCFTKENLVIVSKITDDVSGVLYLLRRTAEPEMKKIIRISEKSSWLDELKASVLNENETTWIVSEDCPSSGIIGMINCLRNEPGGDLIRCVFIPEREKNKLPRFSFEDSFFRDVLKKDLLMNVLKDNKWGSFRHVRIDKDLQTENIENSYIDIKRYGDFSSLFWKESDLKYRDAPENEIVHVYYSALNFKDVMIASGKISAAISPGINGTTDGILGFEVSGRNKYGERVVGVVRYLGLATAAQIVPQLSMPVPDSWSLEDAATVPVVYATSYYALIIRGRLKRGESILIHSGTGGVGLASITIALSMNCEVYTTVGTAQKRKFLQEHFPSIKSENIGCSRDTSFEKMIMKRTKGKGVNVVLNSLAGEKFHASIRCVSPHGRFLEIGKYDIMQDNKLGMKFFLKNIQFQAVFLDQEIIDNNVYNMKEAQQLVLEGIRSGVVKPLPRTVFDHNDAEKAFRYMGSGTHIGKVLLKIRDEEKEKYVTPTKLCLPAVPVTYFYPHKVYIIIGGLGGFGIEITKWLLKKGARNVILTTRYGSRTPYHHFCLRRWKDAGYNVTVSTRNVSEKEEASKLLKEASEIGPVGGIFNSAVVLHDAFLENTNLQSFHEVCAPKAYATRNLDILSRCLCPELDHFVCFSSISCGRGNAGQMNYGYANSVMERVCELRRKDGFPGVAIQWGIIGEVGVVHRHMGDDAMIAGVVAQRVKSCLDILDRACQMNSSVVCSYVAKDTSSKRADTGDTLQQLCRIFGFKDASEFSSVRSFGEMGVDSMIGIEVKLLLETACDVTFTMKEIQDLKLSDVKELLKKTESGKKKDLSSTVALVSTASVKLPKSPIQPTSVKPLNSVKTGVPFFILDIDSGDISGLSKISSAVDHPVFSLTLSKETPTKDVMSLASWYLEKIKEHCQQKAHLLAQSCASVLAIEIVQQAQKKKLSLNLTVMNGYTYLLKVANKGAKSSAVDILCDFVENFIPSARTRLKEQLSEMANLDQQVRSVVDLFTKSSTETVNRTELTEIITSTVKRQQMLEDYVPKQKLAADLLILEDSTKLLANDVAEAKTLLTEICSGKITIQRIPDLLALTDDSARKVAKALSSAL